MDQLELLRERWQSQNTDLPHYSKEQIRTLLAQKSSSIVKWLLIIAIIEFAFFTVLNFFSLDSEYHDEAVELVGAPFYYSTVLFQLVVVLFFIYLFWRNYTDISATQPTRQLMRNIMKTRKTMKWYIWFNLIYLMVFMMVVAGIMLYTSPELEAIRNSQQFIEHPYQSTAIYMGIWLVFTLIICALMWGFYYLLYGILLKRLHKNYQELKRMEV